MNRQFERHGFSFRVAAPADDPAVAALLNDNAMPGWISLSFRTAPGRHRPLWQAVTSETVLAKRMADGRPGGVAARSVFPGFLGGRPAEIGWLGQLRVAPAFRHRLRLLKAGFDAMRAFLHEAEKTPWYLASIVDGNATARRLLEAGLDGLPRFEPLLAYRTIAFAAASSANRFPPHVRPAKPGESPAIAAFLDAQNQTRDFAPRLGHVGFFQDAWVNLADIDFLVHESAGQINGVAAVWDQRPFRSLVVTGYREPLRRLRRPMNLLSAVTGLPRLPPPGAALGQVFFSLPAVSGDDPKVWADLVTAARISAHRKGASLFVAGFAAGDPALAPLLGRFRHRRYDSTIYRVFWPDDRASFELMEPHEPKIEIGLL